jgi:hypothetical protein
MRDLEDVGGMVVQSLLEEDLGCFWLELGNVWVFQDGCEMDVYRLSVAIERLFNP